MAAPEWMEEKIVSELEEMKEVSKKYKNSFSNMTETKLARQRIINIMIRIDRKIRKGVHPGYGFPEFLKD
jgi:hypothetical protein